MRLNRGSVLAVKRRASQLFQEVNRGMSTRHASASSYQQWHLGLRCEPGNPCLQIKEPMPLIRCTMPVPCSVCWYCKQHEARA